jgi:hypothetical protein
MKLFILIFVFINSVYCLLQKRLTYNPSLDDFTEYNWEYKYYKTPGLAKHHFIVATPLNPDGTKPPSQLVPITENGIMKMHCFSCHRRIDLFFNETPEGNKISIVQKLISDSSIGDSIKDSTLSSTYKGTKKSTGKQITDIIIEKNKGRFADGAKYKFYTNNCQHFAGAIWGDITKTL